jgi:hypothetical protein
VLAEDGAFDAVSESLVVELPRFSLPPGRHTLFLRATDVAGQTGVPSAVFVDIDDDTFFLDGFEDG